jgi:predicted RNA binding protein YcfA (HicA-like mRNA interferase family)
MARPEIIPDEARELIAEFNRAQTEVEALRRTTTEQSACGPENKLRPPMRSIRRASDLIRYAQERGFVAVSGKGRHSAHLVSLDSNYRIPLPDTRNKDLPPGTVAGIIKLIEKASK